MVKNLRRARDHLHCQPVYQYGTRSYSRLWWLSVSFTLFTQPQLTQRREIWVWLHQLQLVSLLVPTFLLVVPLLELQWTQLCHLAHLWLAGPGLTNGFTGLDHLLVVGLLDSSMNSSSLATLMSKSQVEIFK